MYNETILVMINKIKQKVNVDYNVTDFWKDRFNESIDINDTDIEAAEDYATFQTLEEIEMLNETDEPVFEIAKSYGFDYGM